MSERNPWRDAVLDGLACNFALCEAHLADPQLALADLIHHETQIALDPRVSRAAVRLRLEGIQIVVTALEQARASVLQQLEERQEPSHDT